ncbi:DUF2937 family protein [Roseibium aggregatum]|uniref:DUF2937 family protein n=1 Tax=Roseibium aggregatum TaxID=187304 RepID=A0A939EH41_9HYPH|nr:DUF2937 family protein [Roseibium aggregatum]MBN9672352.1 DUF2937 family protein [Roseibium aggregatum]
MVRILMLVVMLLSGTATSQLPEFSQQYRQRLGGAIDALEEILADFRRDAEQFGLTVQQAIQRQRSSPDPFVRARGNSMAVAETRLDRLKRQQRDLAAAGPVQRMVIFAQGFDARLARATADDFEPAIPVTLTGFASAGVGGLAGFLLVRLLVGLARFGGRRRPVRD